ncbi:hypothetical protein M405DRAFT_866488, partial [Rhizopogon salebrosus TDB-379]
MILPRADDFISYNYETRPESDPTSPLPSPSPLLLWLTNSTAIASQSLSTGYGRMSNLNVTVRRSAPATNTVPPTPTIIVTELTMQSLASETVEECTRKDLAHDRQDAEREFYRYEDTGLLHAAERTTNIVHIWEQKEHTFLLLFRVAMDVLPAQASS